MAEGIATSFALEILKELLHYAAAEANLARTYKSELEMLDERSKLVAAFLSDAQSKTLIPQAVQLWLERLKGTLNDADTVLDEFRYELIRQKVEVRNGFMRKVIDFFSRSNNPLAFRLKLSHNIKNINSKLDAINNRAQELGLLQNLNNASQLIPLSPPTHSRFDPKSVVGRDDDMSVVVENLLSLSDAKELPVVSICGMGGQGKTTLARLVCKNDRVVGRFQKQFWVCVSTDFSVNRVLNEMLQSFTGFNQNMSNIDAMISSLSEELSGKRYLLILDDVWHESLTEWKSMRDALVGIEGSNGSSIVVTCRDKNVALFMHSSFTHDLSILSPNDSWTLFKNKAFADGGPLETMHLVKIGEDIVKRCGGVPLAIDVLGSLMHSKESVGEWLAIRNSLEENLNQVHDILKISYHHLSPSSLKSCFAFMSILPKDSDLEKNFFVQTWAAFGLLPLPKNGKFLFEDVGDEYFHSLVRKSLLQDVCIDNLGNIESCRMHDLVHDLALQVSNGYCFTVSDSDQVSRIPYDVVHLNFVTPERVNIEKANICFHKLQTLIFGGSLPENVASRLSCLRVLVLKDYTIMELPPSIRKLKHLRYLDISKTMIMKLPTSITRLYNLQTLKAGNLDKIPKKFGNLVNLRHFVFSGFLFLSGVGKLTALQTLSKFTLCRSKGCTVGDLGGLSNLKGKLAISQLEEVESGEEAKSAKLDEKSRIEALKFEWKWNRENSKEEDVLEGLRPHSELKRLVIINFKGVKFSSWMISDSVSVLNNLVEIRLVRCDGCEQVPTLGHLANLKKVKMIGLKKVKWIGEEFYHCHHDGNVINHKMELFPSLRELVIRNMVMLENWMDAKQVCPSLLSSSSSSSVASKTIQFPNLEMLEIRRCKNLMGVPSRFPYLKRLRLNGVNNSRLEFQNMSRGLTCLIYLQLENMECEMESVLEHLLNNNSTTLAYVEIKECNQVVELPKSLFKVCVALKKLRIYSNKLDVTYDGDGQLLSITNCSNIKVFPDVGRPHLTSLRRLEFTDCPFVTCLPDLELLTGLQSLLIGGFSEKVEKIPRMPSSLKTLMLRRWPKVRQLPQQQIGHLSALKRLVLKHMEELEALPEWLMDLSSLQELDINNCKKLNSMPTAEATRGLKMLVIERCPLLNERCIKGSGTDWHYIQHIPYIRIDLETIQSNKVD